MNVQLPDGSVVQFPDDMPTDQVNSALNDFWSQQYPQQIEGAAREPLIAATNTGEGLIANTLGLPGDVGSAIGGAYDKYIGNPIAKAVTGEAPSVGLQDVLSKVGPSSKQVEDLGKQAGVWDRPDLKPDGEGEELLAAGSRGLGSAIPFALAPEAELATTGKAIAQGAGAGAGAQVFDKYAPDWLPGKQLIGALLGGGTASGAANTTERAVNMASGKVSPVLQAYQDLGITPRLVGDVSQNPTMQGIQAVASKWPMSAGKVSEAAQKTNDEFGQAIENMAGNLGSSKTLQEAGSAVQDNGKKWLKDFQDDSADLHSTLDAAVGPSTPVPLYNTTQLFHTLKNKSANNSSIQSFLTSPLMKQFGQIVETSPDVPWETSRALKTRVGQYLENPDLIADAGGAQAKQLYGALSSDQKAAIQDPATQQLFDAANAYTTQGHQFIDNVLGDVLAKGTNPSDVASSLLSSGVKGGEKLAALRQNMPDAADELAAVSLRRTMAGSSEGAEGNAVSPDRWLSNRDPTRRLSPEAYQALYPSPDLQQKMTSADTVAKSMKGAQSLVNKSNSGHQVGAALLAGDALVGIPEAIRTGYEMGGLKGALIAASGPTAMLGVGPLNSRLAVNPSLARFMSTPITASPYGYAPSLAAIPRAKGGRIRSPLAEVFGS